MVRTTLPAARRIRYAGHIDAWLLDEGKSSLGCVQGQPGRGALHPARGRRGGSQGRRPGHGVPRCGQPRRPSPTSGRWPGRCSAAGYRADGFSLNVANFRATEDTVEYGRRLSGALDGVHFVVDTSRNGNGHVDGDTVDGVPTFCNHPGGRLYSGPTLPPRSSMPTCGSSGWASPTARAGPARRPRDGGGRSTRSGWREPPDPCSSPTPCHARG